MIKVSVKLKGSDEMKRRLRQEGEKFQRKLGEALYEEMLIEAREVFVRTPYKTGALRESEKVGRPVWTGNRVSVTISANTDYALIVHEDLEAFHPIGEAKFIESVLNESAPHMAERVGRRLSL